SLSRNSEFRLPTALPKDGILPRHNRRDCDLDLASCSDRSCRCGSCNSCMPAAPPRLAKRPALSGCERLFVRKFCSFLRCLFKGSSEKPLFVSLLGQRLHATRPVRRRYMEMDLRTLLPALQESRWDARSTSSSMLLMRMFRVVPPKPGAVLDHH